MMQWSSTPIVDESTSKLPTKAALTVPAMVAPRKETLVPTVLEKEATPCMEGSNKRRDKAVSRPRSMRDLSRVKAQSRDEPFLVQEIVDLPKLSGEGPLEAR
ncbi:hypothetical protein GW17_00046417 [Ensete ventricosum]|nr:hypothetical protein GW17_00046417 [Ensete ventricosum]RZR80801.1 hypothetical protein BHM03_00006890 [Ensete ventricosum]